MTAIQIKEVCKIGKGAECCRYLGLSNGFRCLKLTELRETIDERFTKGLPFTAQGDNCSGIPFEDNYT
jgi:hypothetical protein